MIGADPDALERLASDFDRAAGTLEATANRVRVSVHANPWSGARATRFRNDWDQRHGPQLKRVATALRSASTHLRLQAQEQRRASSAGGVASGRVGGAGGGEGEGARPWWLSLDPHLGQGRLFNTLDILLGLDQVRIDNLLKDLKGTPMGDYLAKAASHPFFRVVGKVAGGLGLLGVVNDLSAGFISGDSAQINAGFRGAFGTAAGAFMPVLGVAAAAAELYGSAMLPTTQAGFAGTTDRALRNQFGDAYDPAMLSTQQAEWLTRRYEGVGGFFNAVSDGVDYQMRWLGDPAAKAGRDFGEWRRANGWPW